MTSTETAATTTSEASPGEKSYDGYRGDHELDSIDDLNAEAQPNSVDMVVFDLGRVLIEWEPMLAIAPVVGEEAARAFLNDEGLNFAALNLQADGGRPWSEILDEIERTHPAHLKAARAYVENFAAAVPHEITGSVDILRELADADVPVFAVTNFSADLFPVAEEKFGFLDLFEEIIVSGEEGVAKPDPEIWEILEETTRHVGGLFDAVFIDDSPANVMSAEEAGLDAICFTDPDSLRDELRLRGLPLRGSTSSRSVD